MPAAGRDGVVPPQRLAVLVPLQLPDGSGTLSLGASHPHAERGHAQWPAIATKREREVRKEALPLAPPGTQCLLGSLARELERGGVVNDDDLPNLRRSSACPLDVRSECRSRRDVFVTQRAVRALQGAVASSVFGQTRSRRTSRRVHEKLAASRPPPVPKLGPANSSESSPDSTRWFMPTEDHAPRTSPSRDVRDLQASGSATDGGVPVCAEGIEPEG